MRARTVLTAFAIAVATVCGSAVQAGEPGCGHGGMGHGGVGYGLGGGAGYGWAYGMGIAGLYNGLDRYTDYRVPYFAAHPPVYYSYPVPRTYGHSPFAYPPHFRTPDCTAPLAPVTINNPYVPASDSPVTEEKASDETVQTDAATKPLVVLNPYVIDTALASAGR